ncbi:hypothetical protein JK386_11910 [Nocardioides sp. zg-536]|uniref:Mce-associated membrane protein n=1 Tax=Nocardioides faecalis TaxID=2803858 RepID=A0A938Y7B9_9ACTN|nr:hypothetical protein [Nocardioides faecalis]MBM9460610.1 hypothetical protein [Nocardioides faecalis]QVI57469.1 hypothetical protein KG111_10160 [Nocardioides faecalis]
MSRPTSRRSVSSRGTTPRPRKIAGRDAGPREDGPDDLTTESTEPTEPTETTETTETKVGLAAGRPVAPASADTVTASASAKTRPARRPPASAVTRPAAGTTTATTTAKTAGPDVEEAVDAATDAPRGPGVLARPRTTRVLTIVLAVIAVVLAVQAVWFFQNRDGGEGEAAAADAPGRVSVPKDRPVVAGELFAVEGVDAAAKAAQEIVAVDFNKYDDEVEAAAKLMTARFEEQYRTTAGDIKDDFVANKTVVQSNVVAQGVVRANRTRLQALVFLNQVVTRNREGKPETVVTPYKVLVTMVHTDQGWLVDGLDTDAPQDKSN